MTDERFDQILAEMRSEHEAWIGRMDRRLDQTDDLLRFVGELDRRSEIALQDLLRGTAAMRAEIRESIKEIKVNSASMRVVVSESKANSEASKAHTRALFALIDRLENGGGGLAPNG